MPQSRRRHCSACCAQALPSSCRGDGVDGAAKSSPSNCPELISTPCVGIGAPAMAASHASRACRPDLGITSLIGNPYLLRELEVALVVGRHGHHRAVAVAHQHVIARPRSAGAAGQRVLACRPVGMPRFSAVSSVASHAAAAPALVDEGRAARVSARAASASGCSAATAM